MSGFWDLWERGEHPAQAEVHEPLTEFDGPIGVTPESEQVDELVETTYEVTIYTYESEGAVTVDEIKRALYQGVAIIRTPDAIDVERS